MKRSITFIYSDSAERACFQPVLDEAKKRGYTVKMSDNPFERCEIGFYCQHINHPQYSKFSIIMLHDIIQQYSNWPDIWFKEPWNKYDIGILPSDQWCENWKKSSGAYYTRPRKGVYKIGWPKADAVQNLTDSEYRVSFYEKHSLNPERRTVLYAPAWENDNKEDEFVKAVLPLDVNIIIKQWDADPVKFPNQVENVRKMQSLHTGLPGVTILPPETNIFEAIAASDILVSEESSTMCEATMMGIPAVSVSDWLIPDVSPSRFPKCDYDFVYMTTKKELSSKVKDMLDHYDEYKEKTEMFCKANFCNIGRTSSIIMDIIDDCVAGRKVSWPALKPVQKERLGLKKSLRHKVEQFRREASTNYAVNNKAFGFFWKKLTKIKRFVYRTRG